MKDNVKPNGVNDDIKLDDVKPTVRPVIVKVNMCEHFTNKQEIIVHEHMLQWVLGGCENGVWCCNQNNGLDRRQTFVTMRCKRGGTYQPRIRNLKWDDMDRENMSVCLNCADNVRWMTHRNLMWFLIYIIMSWVTS